MPLKEKLKSGLKSLKQKARRAVGMLMIAAAVSMVLGGVGLLAANAPYLHKTWIRNKVGKEVVMIVKRDELGRVRGGGTGFHVIAPSSVSYIMTNSHVCDAFDDGTAWIQSREGRIIPRKIIEQSEKTDLCLIEGLPGHEGLKLAGSANIGDTLAVVGHPVLQPLSISLGDIIGKDLIEFPYAAIVDSREDADGKDKMTEEQCASKPKQKVAELDSWLGPVKVCMLSLQAFQTTIVGFPGNSGSPAVNFWGNIEGVLYAGNGRTNYSLLITLDDVKEFLAPY